MPRQRKHMQSSNASYAPTAVTSPSASIASFETSMGSDRHKPVSLSTRYTSYRVRYRCLPPLSICLVITFLCIAAAIVIPIVLTRNSNSNNNDAIITSTASNNKTTNAPTSKPATVPSATTVPIQVRPTVRNMYNHDSNAFTQGLEFVDGTMYESTGLYGKSTLRIVNYETGTVVKQKPLDSMYFAEGLTVLNNRIYQITWQENIGFIYHLNLTQIGTFPISTQGWGLCHDDTHLILSDGSDKLYFINPTTFVVDRSVSVTRYDGSKRVVVNQINELEYIDGYVYANLWYSDTISVIEPTTGYVVKEINLDRLRRGAGVTDTMVSQNGAVCNGITYDRPGARLFITGKLWPKLVEIDVILPLTPAPATRRRRT